MTEGIAASNSTKNEIGVRNAGGHSSAKNMPMPSASGVAITKAIAAESTVPRTAGQAPNWTGLLSVAVGFQVAPLSMSQPNAARASADADTNIQPMAPTKNTIALARSTVPMRNGTSP